MRIQFASDLHLDYSDRTWPRRQVFRAVADRDVLVLAGDIGRGLMARAFVEQQLDISPVVYVPGNHEYYGRRVDRADVDVRWLELAGAHDHLHYLVGETAEIDGIRFWGAPWYSGLWGARDRRTLARVSTGINDFEWPVHQKWTIVNHLAAHAAQTRQLRALTHELDVVVTHWPPTKAAIPARLAGNPLSPYYVNDYPDMVCEIGARLWISGHVHEAYDYHVGLTRCVSNPGGYPDEVRESPHFRPDRVVEVKGWGDAPKWERPYLPPEGITASNMRPGR
ncbi:MAG: hypothetical protein F4X36_02585 [Gammaproteobacteria bacterium]|nr:hypothetical protein [Gammaproteobacteria bacterium]